MTMSVYFLRRAMATKFLGSRPRIAPSKTHKAGKINYSLKFGKGWANNWNQQTIKLINEGRI